MTTIKIYGASDDLIEVDGPRPFNDEWGAGGNEGCAVGYVELSTGDVFRVAYAEGERGTWAVTHHVRSGRLNAVVITPAPDGEDPDPYTDIAEVTGGIEWVDCWPTWPPHEETMRERVVDRMDDLRGDALRAAYLATRTRP